MNKINRLTHFNFNSLSKEDKLRTISNLSCENYVINEVMKYIKKHLYYSLLDTPIT